MIVVMIVSVMIMMQRWVLYFSEFHDCMSSSMLVLVGLMGIFGLVGLDMIRIKLTDLS